MKHFQWLEEKKNPTSLSVLSGASVRKSGGKNIEQYGKWIKGKPADQYVAE